MKLLIIRNIVLFFVILFIFNYNLSPLSAFDLTTDLISLHYDHADDPDDALATAAGRSVIGELGIAPLVVSGATGINRDTYVTASEAVMDGVWGSGNWLNAHTNWKVSVNEAALIWAEVLLAGGNVWVAEGGQSDFTADVVRLIKKRHGTSIRTRTRIHLIQHGKDNPDGSWNELHTTPSKLAYVKKHTNYIIIDSGNRDNETAHLRQRESTCPNFIETAKNNDKYGSGWTSAFNYYMPRVLGPKRNPHIDFSDTVLLLYILGYPKSEISGICDFANEFLMASDTSAARTFKSINGEVVIEAENYTRLGGTLGGTWFIDKKISGYTETGYIESTKDDPGTTLKFSDNIIRAEYDINFQETGTYYLHLRAYATDHTQNGFHATMNGQLFDYGHEDASYIFVKKNSKWWWYTDGGGIHGERGYKVSINITKTGVHTLAIYRRDSGGSRIDKIWLTKNESSPQNKGSLDLTNPAVFLPELFLP